MTARQALAGAMAGVPASARGVALPMPATGPGLAVKMVQEDPAASG